MNKIKRLLPIINIIVPFIFLMIILFMDNSSEKIYYLLFMTGIIGWAFPLFTMFITGIVELRKERIKLALILNIVSILLNIFILYFIIRLIAKELIVMLIIYIITFIINALNIVYLVDYIKKHIDSEEKIEKENIKKIKKENNGVIK